MKVLCIDDNEDIVRLLDRVLSSKGFNFVSCNNGMDGLKLIKKDGFDVVLLDIAMPYFSGRDVINELKKEKSLSDYNIILFTASTITDDEVNMLLKEGVKDCIRKPVPLKDLMILLKKFEPN